MNPSPWRWIPSLYVVQGLPYAVVMTLSVVMYKNLGVSNTDIALVTSGMYLPWVLKPLWSPLVDLWGSARRWIVAMQALLALGFAALAASLPGPWWWGASLALLWATAIASATHDIAADGFYLQALDPKRQAAFVGVRSTCWRGGLITGQGGLVVLAGVLAERQGDAAAGWATVFALLAAAFAALVLYHLWALPRRHPAPAAGAKADHGRGASRVDARAGAGQDGRAALAAFGQVFVDWFRRPHLVRVLAFLLLYRFAEAQLLKLVVPFLLDAPSAGGLGFDTAAVGIAYGTVGVAALTAGGLLGGWLIARHGLERCLWPLVWAMHLPNLLFVVLAVSMPGSLVLVSLCLAVEQFGYGIGFTAYLVVLLRLAAGPHQVAHYAIGTGFMALGMMLPGLFAGWLQARLGYVGFFVWCCIATVPAFVATAMLRVPEAADDGPEN